MYNTCFSLNLIIIKFLLSLLRCLHFQMKIITIGNYGKWKNARKFRIISLLLLDPHYWHHLGKNTVPSKTPRNTGHFHNGKCANWRTVTNEANRLGALLSVPYNPPKFVSSIAWIHRILKSSKLQSSIHWMHSIYDSDEIRSILMPKSHGTLFTDSKFSRPYSMVG